jgi:hypothetical protein
VRSHTDEIRDALIRQFAAIDRAVPTIDLDRPSRVDGWRNREVVAHLSLQPVLLARFISKRSSQAPQVRSESNLAGTRSLATVIDSAARDAAINEYTFGKSLLVPLPVLAAADLAVRHGFVTGGDGRSPAFASLLVQHGLPDSAECHPVGAREVHAKLQRKLDVSRS